MDVSKRELSKVEGKVLQKGSGFAVADKRIQYDEFVIATQQARKHLSQSHSLALKAEVTDILVVGNCQFCSSFHPYCSQHKGSFVFKHLCKYCIVLNTRIFCYQASM